MGGALGTTAVGVVSASNRVPAHPVNMKENNRAMISISAIPFCQVPNRGYAANAMLHRNGDWQDQIEGRLGFGLHPIAGIFALRPPCKN